MRMYEDSLDFSVNDEHDRFFITCARDVECLGTFALGTLDGGTVGLKSTLDAI